MANRTLEATERAAKLWLEGMTPTAAADECGISKSTLFRHIKKLDLKRSMKVRKQVALSKM